MSQITELWHDTFANIIPKDTYTMQLEQGEKQGLIILLEGLHHEVTLNFGIVQAVNILDEGVQLNEPCGVSRANLDHLRKTGYSNTLYLVENGAYGAYIRASMTADVYDFMKLRQYDIVTLNYVVEIVTAYEPEIQIRDKQTGTSLCSMP